MGDYLSIPDREKHSADGENSFLKFGYSSMQGWRKTMEDAHLIHISEGRTKGNSIFGVFDGHGGAEIAQFVANHFVPEFNALITNQKNKDIKTNLRQTFFNVDALLHSPKSYEEIESLVKKNKMEEQRKAKTHVPQKKRNNLLSSLMEERPPLTKGEDIVNESGCTGVVMVVDEKLKRLYFANVGDSRVVLCKNGRAIQMSEDHKPELKKERDRVAKAGGWVQGGRVNGSMNMTRAFGDFEFKRNEKLKPEEQVISCEPDIKMEVFKNNMDFVVIACDGIWECKSNQEVCDFIKKRLEEDPEMQISEVIEDLFDEILPKRINKEDYIGCDNMTCIVVMFKK